MSTIEELAEKYAEIMGIPYQTAEIEIAAMVELYGSEWIAEGIADYRALLQAEAS